MPIAEKAQEAGLLAQRLRSGTPDPARILKRLGELYPDFEFAYEENLGSHGLHITVPAGLSRPLPAGLRFSATRILKRQEDGSLRVIKNRCPDEFVDLRVKVVGPSRWERLRKPVV